MRVLTRDTMVCMNDICYSQFWPEWALTWDINYILCLYRLEAATLTPVMWYMDACLKHYGAVTLTYDILQFDN